MPARFGACFISMSHDHTAIIPLRRGNNAGLHQPHRFHQQTHGSPPTTRFGRGRHSRPRPNLPAGGGVGLGGNRRAGLLERSPTEFLFRGTLRKPGARHGTIGCGTGLPHETAACPAKVGTAFPKRTRSNKRLERDDASKRNHPALGLTNARQYSPNGRGWASSPGERGNRTLSCRDV